VTGAGEVGVAVRPAPWWPGWRTAAELVRLPAVLSVPGDVLVGAAAAGWPYRRLTPGLIASSGCLYWAGMALNDWADRGEDAVDRPGRPIPSGRARPGFALGLAGVLTATGLGFAAAAGGRSALRVAVPLAAAVWAYDLRAKSTVAGPAAMAATRGLDVLLGAGGARACWPAAGTVAAHTVAVTVLSRVETTGGPRAAAAARSALAGTGAVTALAAMVGRRRQPGAAGTMGRLAATALLGGYALDLGRAQLAAARDPRPATVQRAVGTGVLGLIPLQAGLLAGTGTARLGCGLATLWPLARRLSRRVSPT
jgi:4-hydroxybenzoate polyprenyltransferase